MRDHHRGKTGGRCQRLTLAQQNLHSSCSDFGASRSLVLHTSTGHAVGKENLLAWAGRVMLTDLPKFPVFPPCFAPTECPAGEMPCQRAAHSSPPPSKAGFERGNTTVLGHGCEPACGTSFNNS